MKKFLILLAAIVVVAGAVDAAIDSDVRRILKDIQNGESSPRAIRYLKVLNDADIDGNLVVDGVVSGTVSGTISGGDVTGTDVTAVDDVTAGDSIVAGTNITAGATIQGEQLTSTDDIDAGDSIVAGTNITAGATVTGADLTATDSASVGTNLVVGTQVQTGSIRINDAASGVSTGAVKATLPITVNGTNYVIDLKLN